ncbi:MAG: IclR family transcriptional regulator [Pseudonocardiales bacterium]|nr:MAG: IclR family transcriptional regulator [Pseudonocardiales bacterium]
MGQSSGIGVLDKAVTILHATARSPMGLAALVVTTGLPRATVHRIAVALETHRLLARDADGRWAPGPALGELARSGPDALLAEADRVLGRLRDQTGESAQLYRRIGSERICIAASELPQGLRDTVPVGTRLPMTAGSGAQVLAAWSAPDDVAALLGGAAYSARVLADVRRRGYAQSVAERAQGVASVSAPVRDAGGTVVAAVSVSGPVDRLGRRPAAVLAGPVLAAATALGRAIAG